jgi:hypothetical protein
MLSSQRGIAEGIALSWHPHPARAEELVTGDRFDFVGIKLEGLKPQEEARMLFPISVTGLPTDSVLKTDLGHVVFSRTNGKQLFSTDGDR